MSLYAALPLVHTVSSSWVLTTNSHAGTNEAQPM